MKDYSLSEDENGEYITNIKYNRDKNTYIILFADGSRMINVAANEDNLEKIKKAQEEQAERGVENLNVFINRKAKDGIMSFISGIGTATIASCFCTSPILNSITSEHPVITIAGIGIISILGAIPAYVKFKKNKEIVEEIEKIKYRNAHRETLDTFRDYPNALTGISSNTASSLVSLDDPFSILNIDEYTEEDLKNIIDNIHKEEKFDFEYPKKYSKSK